LKRMEARSLNTCSSSFSGALKLTGPIWRLAMAASDSSRC